MPKTIYPSRKCLNPSCPNKTFIPKRSDAKYCDSVCRSNHHFNLHKQEAKSKYRLMADIKQADKKLRELYKSCQDQNQDHISAEAITINRIPLNSALQISVDKKTTKKIFWFYDYGIMGIERNKFKIVKKSDYGQL